MNLLQIIFIYLALRDNNNNVSACGKTFDAIFQTISSSTNNNVNVVSDDIFLNENANENCLWSLWSSWSVAFCSDPSKNCNFAQFRTRTILNKNLQEEENKEKQICQGQDRSYKNVCCISDSSRSQSFTIL